MDGVNNRSRVLRTYSEQQHYEKLLRDKVLGRQQEKDDEIRRAYGLTDRDTVQIIRFPKGKGGKMLGSFVYRPMTLKAQNLQQQIYITNGKLRSAQFDPALSEKERAKKMQQLRCNAKYLGSKLNAEIASTPRTGMIVIEDDE